TGVRRGVRPTWTASTLGLRPDAHSSYLILEQLGERTMPAKPKVFVSRIIPAAGLAQIEASCAADVWRHPWPPAAGVLRARGADCAGLVPRLTPRVDGGRLARAPRLKVVTNFAVASNNPNSPACTERGICAGNTPGVLTDATADMAFCLL